MIWLSAFPPWNDRRGCFSWFRLAAFLAILAPAGWIAFEAITRQLGPRPLTAAIQETGLWTIRLLFLSLAATPLRAILDWRQPTRIRRMLGLAALAYAVGHVVLNVADQRWDLGRAATEIVLRFYLLIGLTALAGLLILGMTSNDAAVRRLGHVWKQIHKASYAIALLAVFHFFLQSKINATEATMMAGFLSLLFLYRLLQHRVESKALTPAQAGGAAMLGALSTVAIEYAWTTLATGLSGSRILMAYLAFPAMIRPAYWVLFSGLGIALLGFGLRLARAR